MDGFKSIILAIVKIVHIFAVTVAKVISYVSAFLIVFGIYFSIIYFPLIWIGLDKDISCVVSLLISLPITFIADIAADDNLPDKHKLS